MSRKSSRSPAKKKRTITPEQQAKMQAGRQRAKIHEQRMEVVNRLEEKMRAAEKKANEPVRMKTRHKRKYPRN